LRELILDNPAADISLGELLTKLGERAFGFMRFLLAFPNCLPMPPGFSTVTGLPILFLAVQFLLGERKPNLPRFIRERRIDRQSLVGPVNTIMGGLVWFEKLFKPRFLWLSEGWPERAVGILILCMTLILVVPMPPPFNLLPAGAIAIIALGVIERDGLVIGAGSVLALGTLVSVVVFADFIIKVLGLIYGFVGDIPHQIMQFFGL
jgi:hypothetical protein